METETLIILINIAIIGIIASVIVKLYYRDEEKENKTNNDDFDPINKTSTFQNALSSTKNAVQQTKEKIGQKKEDPKNREKVALNNVSTYFSSKNPQENNVYSKPRKTQEYKSWEEPREIRENTNNVASKVFHEPIENRHKEMMNKLQNKETEEIKVIEEDINVPLKDRVKENKKSKIEQKPSERKEDENLKELFNIDALIEKAKEKDSSINNHSDEDIESKDFENKESHQDEIENNEKETYYENSEIIENIPQNLENINSHENKSYLPNENLKAEEISENKSYLPNENLKAEEISENKEEELYSDGINLLEKEETEDEFGKSLANSNMFDDDEFDLLDFEEIKESINNSKIVKNVKKFAQEKLIDLQYNENTPDDDFIRNVNKYDRDNQYAEDKLRKENTAKIFNMNNNKELKHNEEFESEKKEDYKPKNSIEVKINNSLENIKKGETIIFNYNGENYSSKLLNIYGNDVEVTYRGQNILINSNNIKKRI